MRLALLTVGLMLSFTAASAGQTPTEPAPIAASARAEAAKAKPDPAATTQEQEPGVPGRTRLMLGIALKSTTAPGDGTGDSIKPSFIWKWRGKTSRQDDRFGLAYGLNSVRSRFSSLIGAEELPVGDVKLRPLMAGLEYKMPRGKWTYHAGVQAGWSINNVETTGAHRDRFRRATGSDDVWMDVRNSFVVAPKVKAWYDFNRRIALQFDGVYFRARPEMMLRLNGVESRGSLNADAFVLKAGILYGIF